MFCRHCGMDSQTTNVCEWCQKPLGATGEPAPTAQPLASQNRTMAMPLNAQPQPLNATQAPVAPGTPLSVTQPVQAPPAPQYRTSLTGDVVEVAPPAAQPQQTQYTANLRAAATALPAGAYTAAFVNQRAGAGDVSFGERFEFFLGLAMPTMALCVLLVHLSPANMIWAGIAATFLVSLYMGATRVIPSYDDAFADCAIVLVVAFLLGPMIAIAAYFIVGAIKQEMNWAMIGLLVGVLAVRIILVVTATAGSPLLLVLVFAGFMDFLGFFGVCIAFAGWFISNFFRPVNE